MHVWEYCGKEDTRIEGPMDFGLPPAARNKAGDLKERNKLILEKGPLWAVEEGLVCVTKFK